MNTFQFRLSAAVFCASILAACAGGTVSAPAPGPSSSLAPQLILEQRGQPDTTLTASALANDSSGKPRWKFYDALTIASDGSFVVAPTYTTCNPTNALSGPWYYSYGSFSLPNSATTLASCVLYKEAMIPAPPSATPSPTPSPTATATPTPTPAPTATPPSNIEDSDDLYIVKVDVSSSGAQIGAIAGPATVSPTQFAFPSLVNPESFQSGHFYEFYVAKYLEPSEPVPVAR